MKKMYVIPETKVSEFKGQELCVTVSIVEGEYADGTEVLANPRDDENWGDLWN